MILEKTKGIILENEFVSEDNYDTYGILDINDFLSKYISKYGYKVKKIYDYSKNLVIIEPNNLEYLIRFGMNQELVYNYQTGEIILEPIIPNPNEKIDSVARKDRNLYYVNGHLSLFTIFIDGINYIYDVVNNKSYPILYTNSPSDDNEICITCKDHNNGNITIIKKIDNESYSYLINNFNFIFNGTPKRALNFDIAYGIKYVDDETNYVYYHDKKSRDDAYLTMKNSIKNTMLNSGIKVNVKKMEV